MTAALTSGNVKFAIQNALSKIPTNRPIVLASLVNNNLAYEIYCLSQSLYSIKNKYQIVACDGAGNPLPPFTNFIFRKSQSFHVANLSSPCFFKVLDKLTFSVEYELHNRVKVTGMSNVSHEIDVGYFIGKYNKNYNSYEIRLALECKNYSTGSSINTGLMREQLGLKVEVKNVNNQFLITSHGRIQKGAAGMASFTLYGMKIFEEVTPYINNVLLKTEILFAL